MSKKQFSSLSLIIPIFNNEQTAVKQITVCDRILRSFTSEYEIILCDDKSTDNTKAILKKNFEKNKHINLIFHSKNEGVAKTIKSLYYKAKHDYILLFSVDGDWEPEDIKKMLIKLQKSNADIVIGKRYKTNYTSYRKVVSFFYNFIPRILFGVTTIDAGSIKIIKRALLKKIHIISNSIFFEAEIIIKAKKAGYTITSVPVHYYKVERGSGKGAQLQSVISALKDSINVRLHL